MAVGNATIVRVRKAATSSTDRYGDALPGDPTRTTLDRAFVAPRSSSDMNEPGRTGVIVGLTLFAPYGTDLVHTDQVEVDGVPYDIDGEPGQWKHPRTGWEAGMEVALKRAAG